MKHLKYMFIITVLYLTTCFEKTGSLIPEEPLPLNIVEHDIYFRSKRDGQYNIYKMGFYGENVTQVTKTGYIANFRFTPDGLKIIYLMNYEGNKDLYIINNDGSEEINLTNLSARALNWDLSADGKKLIYSRDTTLFLLNLETGDLKTYIDRNTTHLDINNLFWNPKFLAGAERVVYMAIDAALKVLDIKDDSTRYICERCIFEYHHFQVFPYDEKVFIQMSQYGETYIFNLNPPMKI